MKILNSIAVRVFAFCLIRCSAASLFLSLRCSEVAMEMGIANASRVDALQLFELRIDGGSFIEAYEPLGSGDTVAIPYGLYEKEIGPMVGSLLYDERIKPNHKAFHHLAFVFHQQVPRPLLVSLILPSMHSINAVALDVIANDDTCLVLVAATPINEQSVVNKIDDQLFLIPRTNSTGGENALGPNGGNESVTAMALWTLEVRPQLLICPMERKFTQIQSSAGLMVALPQPLPTLPLGLQWPKDLFPSRKDIDEDHIVCQLPYCSCEYKCNFAVHESHRRQKTIKDDLDDTEQFEFCAKKEVLTSSFFILCIINHLNE